VATDNEFLLKALQVRDGETVGEQRVQRPLL